MPLRLIADAHNVDNTDKRPLLVTISAHALSSVGFGLSIFAIWIHWLFLCDERGQDQPMLHGRQPVGKAHRQPSPSHHGNPRDVHSPRHAKHVSFADAKNRHVARRATVPIVEAAAPEPHALAPDSSPIATFIARCNSPQPITHDVTVTASPTSSSSTIAQATDDRQEVSDTPSQTSSKSSLPTDTTRKSDGFFARRKPCKKRGTSSSNEKPSKPSPVRECCRRATSLKAPLEKLSSRALPRSATFSFGTPHARQSSAPVPRTMPYGPPYFATPPCQ